MDTPADQHFFFFRNFIYTKKFFWFGSEPIDVKKTPALLKDHHIAAWASETGKGLLFFAEKGTDKTTPSSAIQLVSEKLSLDRARIVQPVTDISASPMLPSPPPRALTSSFSPPRVTSTPSRPPPPPSATTGSPSSS